MPKLEFKEKMNLTLNYVLSRKIPVKEVFGNGKQVEMLQNWIKAKGYHIQGPLIMYSGGIKGTESDGTPIVESKLLTQLKEGKIKAEYPYKFEQQIRLEKCLYVRFCDKKDRFQFASMELQLYAYKNDVLLTGEMYTVLIEDKEIMIADVFMPVKQQEDADE
ncbi:MAG: hypothetical protein LBU60_05480 [Clostridiales bacterium]|jgi:hypothetical protein|nr:hypothetical protein [Clostridiales bacterium]